MKKLIQISFIIVAILCLATVIFAEDVQIVEPSVSQTADSVGDVSWEIVYDELTKQTYIVFDSDTFGTCIYDNPETDFIDGIRINDQCVTSTKVPIDVTKANTIIIRTVYKDDFTGILAQISDGTYDYTKLLSNPIVLFTVIYYILAIVSVFITIIAALRNKNKQVKTGDEIASTVDKHAEEAYNNLTTNILQNITTTLTPLFKNMSDTQEAIVKSIVLMNSKDSNTHLEALECLKKVSNSDVLQSISKISDELQTSIAEAKTHKEHIIEGLNKYTSDNVSKINDPTFPVL